MPATATPSSAGRRVSPQRRAAAVVVLATGLLLVGCMGTPWAATGTGDPRVGATRAAGSVTAGPPSHRLAHAAGLTPPVDGLRAVWGSPGTMPAGGGAGTVVAIVDSGADLQHPSLQGHLWSNPREIVLTPFMGVGSECYGAVINDRRAIGIELKPSYFRQAVRNMEYAANRDVDEMSWLAGVADPDAPTDDMDEAS